MENERMPDDKPNAASDILEKIMAFMLARKGIAIRFLYTVMYYLIFVILTTLVNICAVVQYVFLFATTKPHEQLRKFSNKINTYTYKVMRYMTVTENTRPYPFSDLPPDVEPIEEEIKF